jgi:hypothetical protein
MTDARRRRRPVSTTAITLLALAAASEARAACTANVVGDHVFALAGDDCFASGLYTPTTPIPSPPDNIVGLFAQNGGSITASAAAAAITIHVNGAAGGYGLWSEGVGPTIPPFPSRIDLFVPVTVTTSGAGSMAFYASNGGTIATPDAPIITMTGTGAIGLYASGSGSSITAGGGAAIATGRPLGSGGASRQ